MSVGVEYGISPLFSFKGISRTESTLTVFGYLLFTEIDFYDFIFRFLPLDFTFDID